jgi:superfamily I DNA/RNA helicase
VGPFFFENFNFNISISSSTVIVNCPTPTSSMDHHQRIAVSAMDRLISVSAGPGSGKTRVLIERVARLLCSGVDPSKIAIISFTNKAVDEIRSRLYNLGISHASIRQLHLGTFHRFGKIQILQGNEEHFGRSHGFRCSNGKKHLEEYLEAAGVEKYDSCCSNPRNRASAFKKAISFTKSHGWTSLDQMSPTDRKDNVYEEIINFPFLYQMIAHHESFLESQNFVDINDFIIKVCLFVLTNQRRLFLSLRIAQRQRLVASSIF